MAGQRIICSQQAKLHQRGHQRDKAGGIAARNSHAVGGAQSIPFAMQLRQAIHPIRCGAVCGRSVQNTHIGAQQGHNLPGCSIRQAQKAQIALVNHGGAGIDVLAVGFGNVQDLKFIPRGQTVRNAQAGGAGRTIYKNFILSHPKQTPIYYSIQPLILLLTSAICFSTLAWVGPP